MKKGFFKENFFVVTIGASIVLVVINVIFANSSQKLKKEVIVYQEQVQRIKEIKKKVEDFYKNKPYLDDESFSKIVPLGVITPLEAIRAAGIVVLESGIYGSGSLIVGVPRESKDKKDTSKSRRTSRQRKSETLIKVGAKKVKLLPFVMELTTTYESLIGILKGLSAVEPAILLGQFDVNRSCPPYLLETSLLLITFTEEIDEEESSSSSDSSFRSRPKR